jgi:hypothetical protein
MQVKLEQVLGKKLPHSREFKSESTFGAHSAAERFCRELGFSVGRMCNVKPIGIKRGSWDIQKWRNLSSSDKKLMDGVIVPREGFRFRGGPVVVFYNDSEGE